MPMVERFEIFFVPVAATGQEEQRAADFAVSAGQVDPPDRVAVGREPAAFGRVRGDTATDGKVSPGFRGLANVATPALVTVW